MTGFDFSDTNITNLHPILERENKNYIIFWDVDQNWEGAYDLIYGSDLTLENTKITVDNSIFADIFDFDYNDAVTALEQAILIQRIPSAGYLQDRLPSGLTISDFKTF